MDLEGIVFITVSPTIFKRESSAQVFLVGSQGTRLKIDLVNDIAIHYASRDHRVAFKPKIRYIHSVALVQLPSPHFYAVVSGFNSGWDHKNHTIPSKYSMNGHIDTAPDYAFLKELLPTIIWDYVYDPDEICAVFKGTRERSGHFTRENLLQRMIERLRWYDIVHALGIPFITTFLSPAVLRGVRDTLTRQKYDRVRKILHGEAVSAPGWDSEYRQSIEATLLSHRWYRTQ